MAIFNSNLKAQSKGAMTRQATANSTFTECLFILEDAMKEKTKRFMEKVQFLSNGCWLWIGARKRGRERKGIAPLYGAFGLNGKTINAHVVSYLFFNGMIKAGLEIDHLCRNTLCVNPAHLEAVTHSINCKRGLCGEHRKEECKKITHCPKGHEYNSQNTYINKHTGHRSCIKCTRERTQQIRLRAKHIKTESK